MIVDFIILACVGAGFYFGFKKGFIYSFLSFFGVFVGFLIALKFATLFSVFLADVVEINRAYLPPIAFIILFVGLILSFKLVAWLLEGALKLVMLNLFNKIAGGFLWAILSLLIASACFWFLSLWEILPGTLVKNSILFEQVRPLAPILIDQIGKMIPLFEGIFDTFEDLLNELD